MTSDFIYHVRGEDVTGMENFKEWVSSDLSIFPDIGLENMMKGDNYAAAHLQGHVIRRTNTQSYIFIQYYI